MALIATVASFAMIALAATAHGAPVVYFGGPDTSKLDLPLATSTVTPVRDAFLATLVTYGVEDLESLAGESNPALNFGSTGITAQAGFPNGVLSAFQFAVSGLNFMWDADGVDDWILFSRPITAFGAYIVQGGDGASAEPDLTPPNQLTIRLENTLLGTSKDVLVGDLGPDWPFFNVVFVGITAADPFDRVSFIESYDIDGLLYDDLIAGYVIPEPATAHLLVAGGAALCALRLSRRRRRA